MPVVSSPDLSLRLRPALADLVDLAAVGLAGALVGGTATVLAMPTNGDGWAELGAALLGFAVGLAAAAAAWIALLVGVARRRSTPGERLLRIAPGRTVPAAVGRHAALLVTLWMLAAVVAASIEPWPAHLGGAAAGALGTAAAVIAYGTGPWRRRAAVVGIGLAVGFALAVAVPDRAPYPWELEAASARPV